MAKLPHNRPEKFQKQEDRKVIVLAGDSQTHGRVGENYVSLLSQRLDESSFDLVNAGINSHLAWNLLQRMDEIIGCEPDIVTVLIGTNDITAAMPELRRYYSLLRMELPRVPDRDWFRDSLHQIVTLLQEKTQARIGLISIPPIGEDPQHSAFKTSVEYAEIIQEVAQETDVSYIPFQERLWEYLKEQPGDPTYPFKSELLQMILACFKRYVLRRDWDSIGESKGFRLHIDYLHLNTRAATLLADLVEEFITK
jgi:lysophospholipase L1-like esterase